MLEKTANLAIGKDNTDAWVIVDEKSKKGIKMPDEGILQLTLSIWEDCDKLDPSDLVEKLVGESDTSVKHRETLKMVVDESLSFFIEMGWAMKVLPE